MSTNPGVTMQPGRVDDLGRVAVDVLADRDDDAVLDRDVADEPGAPVPSTIVPPVIFRSNIPTSVPTRGMPTVSRASSRASVASVDAGIGVEFVTVGLTPEASVGLLDRRPRRCRRRDTVLALSPWDADHLQCSLATRNDHQIRGVCSSGAAARMPWFVVLVVAVLVLLVSGTVIALRNRR